MELLRKQRGVRLAMILTLQESGGNRLLLLSLKWELLLSLLLSLNLWEAAAGTWKLLEAVAGALEAF